MSRYLLKHIVVLVQFQSTTEMKDRIDVLAWDKLSMYDQDDLHQFLSSHQSLSDCEDDPAEGAALNQVTQSISRFGQREGLSHDRFDRAGLKQRDNNVPSVSPRPPAAERTC